MSVVLLTRKEEVSLRNQLVRDVHGHDNDGALLLFEHAIVERPRLSHPLAKHSVPVSTARDADDFPNHHRHQRRLVECRVAKVALRLVPVHDTVRLDENLEWPRFPPAAIISTRAKRVLPLSSKTYTDRRARPAA